jgi:hypothetical protein
MAPNTDVVFTSQADLMARDVAAELRTQLGGSDSAAPNLGETLKWYSIPAELILISRPDGSMTWRGLSASGDARAVDLLSTAMDSARRHGNGLMLWPDGFAADSIVLRLSLLPKSFRDASPFTPRSSRRDRFLAFTMLTPVESPSLPKGQLHVRYPSYNEQHRVKGYIITRFVVDTSGKAIMSTFKDLWPADKPRLSGALDRDYTDFVMAVREGVSQQTFTPARVGSCPVPQIVQWPVEFR